MELISFMLIVWAIKVLAEDGYAQAKGQTNPRIERRRARQRSRANNPIWTQFVGWLGDLAEDGRREQTRRRQEKRERQARRRQEQSRREEEARQPAPQPSTEEVDIPLDDPKTPDPEKTASPPDPEPQPEPTPAEPTDDGPTARVIPLFGTKKETEMSTTTGEATGLVSAMDHARAMKKSYEQYAASGDTFVASLANGEVSGEAVAAAQRAREAEQLAAAEWGNCYAALGKQLNVKEAYNATPGAGSREFVTAE